MEQHKTTSALALSAGVAVPILYFGTQLAAAPFYPDYSFLTMDASTLGSSGSTHPAIFNVGAMLTGIAAIVASWGFLHAFLIRKIHPVLALLAPLAVLSAGLGSINAALYPLPDPRHSSGALSIAGNGIFLLPFVLPAALWKCGARKPETTYFIATMIAILPVAVMMSRMIPHWSMNADVNWPGYQYFLNHYHGLLQRIFAAIVFVPAGVAAYVLGRGKRSVQLPVM